MEEYFSAQIKKLDNKSGELYYLIYRTIDGRKKLTCEKMLLEELDSFKKSHIFFDWIFLPVFIKEENVRSI
jgi:hypothetical protein